MATKHIRLSPKAIANLGSNLKNIGTNIDKKSQRRVEEILSEAVIMCKNLTPFGTGDGDHLLFHTFWEQTATGYRIVQRGKNVVYVEFGTGSVGQKHPHPQAGKHGWAYNIGSHIFTTKDGRTGWFFPTGEQYTSVRTGRTSKVYKFTQGQRAAMQMFYTGEWLKHKLGKEIRYVVKREIENGNNN